MLFADAIVLCSIRREGLKETASVNKCYGRRGHKISRNEFRREDEYVGNRVTVMAVSGKRSRGRPKRRCLDNIKNDL